MKNRYVSALALAGFVGVITFLNSSTLTPPPNGVAKVLSHRGVHQTYDRKDLANDTCTATRIAAPSHNFLENTLPSMQAAFAAGADVVELDVHLTLDGVLAVFHDWTLDCRTNGKGVTEETPFSVLRTLDVGYGYTADGGKTFPLRGKGVGLMPRLEEVFDAFPDHRFLINFKSNRAVEGEALAKLIAATPKYRGRIYGVYGGGPPTETALKLIAGSKGYTRASLKRCLVTYLGLGWSGHVPRSCNNQIVAIPADLSWLLWGWPNLFQKRMSDAGSEVILVGPLGSDGFTAGLDTAEQVSQIPRTFAGYVWTNTVETTGPLIKEIRK